LGGEPTQNTGKSGLGTLPTQNTGKSGLGTLPTQNTGNSGLGTRLEWAWKKSENGLFLIEQLK